MSLRNPILPGFNPDPSIIYVRPFYYLATSTFQFFPGVPIYRSPDLVNWTLISHALNRRSQLDMRTVEGGGGIFAPTLRWNKGRFYMTTCCAHRIRFGTTDPFVTPRGFYVWTDNIADDASWSEPIYFDMLGIDQDLFFDTSNDKVYLSTTARIYQPDLPRYGFDTAPWISEIDLPSGRLLTLPRLLRQSPIGIGIAEGSHLYKKDDYHYLITAEGGTETLHQQWVFRSRTGPMGPWETGPEGRINPIVFNAEDEWVQQTGHVDLVEGEGGQWWAVMLGFRNPSDPGTRTGGKRWSVLGRETFLCKVEWEEGWPVLNGREKIGLRGVGVEGMTVSESRCEWKDEFDSDKLQSNWYTVRTPIKPFHSLSPSSGLTIHPSPYSITDDESPSMLLRRQETFHGTWSTVVDFHPGREGEEAGTCVWWSKWAFSSLGVRGKGLKGREMVWKYPVLEDDTIREKTFPLSTTEPIQLRITATPHTNTLSFSNSPSSPDEQPEWTEAGHIPTSVMVRQRPMDSIMTGTHFGVYAFGAHHEPSLGVAKFKWVGWVGDRDGPVEA